MKRKSVDLLNEDSLERIHKESLRILENIGIRVENSKCRTILERAGAKRLGQSDVIRLPASMVLEAIEQSTKTFDFVHPTGERFRLPCEKPMVGTRVKMPKILDYDAVECRPPLRQDVINLCRIHNALQKANLTGAIQYPSCDVPPEIDVADTLGLALAITGNLSMVAPGTVENARTSLDIAAEAIGLYNADKDPGTWVEVNTTSPLVLGEREGDIILHVVGRHIPIDIAPMPVAGVSTPFTLAGTLALGNAESLFLCTLANAIWPGAKIIHSVCGSILNMKAANLSMGAAETCLLSSGELALGKYYGFPTFRMGGYSDSFYPDIQAGIEKMAAMLMLSQSNADVLVLGGPLNCAAHLSYEQVVIDYEIWEMSERIVKEIEVTDETLAYDTIANVGHGGSFIGEPHTFSWVRSGEHYYGGSFNRSGMSGKENLMLTQAHDRIKNILQEPFQYCAPPDSLKRIKQFVYDYAKSKNITPPEWTE